ncbi:MAG: I78 family peptidase inhibitor [Pseudomonadota bacterium]
MRLMLIAFALLLSACTPDQDGASATTEKSDPPLADAQDLTGECPAADLQTLIGQTYTQGLVSYDGRIRVVPPGSIVTMDFLPSRLNIATNADGVITRITCG